jgi:hypothetical protein
MGMGRHFDSTSWSRQAMGQRLSVRFRLVASSGLGTISRATRNRYGRWALAFDISASVHVTREPSRNATTLRTAPGSRATRAQMGSFSISSSQLEQAGRATGREKRRNQGWRCCLPRNRENDYSSIVPGHDTIHGFIQTWNSASCHICRSEGTAFALTRCWGGPRSGSEIRLRRLTTSMFGS